MDDRTTLLFALPDFRILDVTLEPDGGRRVLVESVAEEGLRCAVGADQGPSDEPREGPPARRCGAAHVGPQASLRVRGAVLQAEVVHRDERSAARSRAGDDQVEGEGQYRGDDDEPGGA